VDLDHLRVGSVNRARSSGTGIGGKGQGAFLAAQQLAAAAAAAGEDVPAPRLCMFLGSGREGDTLAELLAERTGGSPDPLLWARVASPCRICTTLLEGSGDATEVVEPSGAVTQQEWEALALSLEEAASAYQVSGGLAALGILGTMPPGVPSDAYAQVIQRVCGHSTRVLIDSVVDVHGTLRAAARATSGGGEAADAGAVMLKLNAREILKLCGREVAGSDSQVAADPVAVAEACRQIAASASDEGERGVDYICFTDGPFPGGLVSLRSGRSWRLERTQKLRGPVMSPIGAGDATSAGTLHAWCRGRGGGGDLDSQALEAFRFGLAVGAASCLTGENAKFDMADVEQILESIVAVAA